MGLCCFWCLTAVPRALARALLGKWPGRGMWCLNKSCAMARPAGDICIPHSHITKSRPGLGEANVYTLMYTKGTLLPAYLSRPLLLRGRSTIQNYAQTKQKNKTWSYAISSFSDSVYFLTLGSSLFLFLSSSSSSSFFSRVFLLLLLPVSGVFCFRRSFSGPFFALPVFLWSLFRVLSYAISSFQHNVCFCFFTALAAWGGNQNV